MQDRYDHRGRLLDEPDDDPACRHSNDANTCQECRADFEREEADYRAWRQQEAAAGRTYEVGEIKDLPF